MKISNGLLLTLLLLGGTGCSKDPGAARSDEKVLRLRQAVAEGKYETAIDLALGIAGKLPLGPPAEEALFLHGYVLAYGKTDFQGARVPLKLLLDSFPKGPHALDAQRLLADCHYWQGHYGTAGTEYRKLLSLSPKEGAAYALFQTAHCLLLDDKVGEALETYRTLIEKHPSNPLADAAQLMLANSHLKLQDYKAAKNDLKKLASSASDREVQKSAQRVLRRIEEDGSYPRGGEEE